MWRNRVVQYFDKDGEKLEVLMVSKRLPKAVACRQFCFGVLVCWGKCV